MMATTTTMATGDDDSDVDDDGAMGNEVDNNGYGTGNNEKFDI